MHFGCRLWKIRNHLEEIAGDHANSFGNGKSEF